MTCAWPVGREQVRVVLVKDPAERCFTPAFLRSRPLPDLVRQLEREYFLRLRADTYADVKRMAKSLGVSVQALYKRLKALGLRPRGG